MTAARKTKAPLAPAAMPPAPVPPGVQYIDSSAPGLYLCAPTTHRAVTTLTEDEARDASRRGACIRLRGTDGEWSPW
mgnify:FL=1